MRIDARHDVVAHDSEPVRQWFQLSGRPRLDDVGNPEDEEAGNPAGGRKRKRGECDELSDDLVYHDGARARELVGEYERLRAELESLWQRIGEL